MSAPTEEFLHEQVASGKFASVDSAIKAAVQIFCGRRASQALESLLDEALNHEGRRVPISELRRMKRV